MGPPVIIKLDPPRDRPGGVLPRLEPLPMDALLFQRPDQSVDRPILLGRVGCNKLLLEPVAPH